eukprot:PhF_6_TR18571/c0_g1_i2/m.27126
MSTSDVPPPHSPANASDVHVEMSDHSAGPQPIPLPTMALVRPSAPSAPSTPPPYQLMQASQCNVMVVVLSVLCVAFLAWAIALTVLYTMKNNDTDTKYVVSLNSTSAPIVTQTPIPTNTSIPTPTTTSP